MSIDWSQVSVDHIKQACSLYDAGTALPKRPAKSAFLHFNGNCYPAKFIRGLAYRIATGIELDPNNDFSGGSETARFFANLGLSTSNNTIAAVPAIPAPTPITPNISPVRTRTYEPQKQALLELLTKQFGTVECEAQFPWLVVPHVNEMMEPLKGIFQALQTMRGYSNFTAAGRSLRCDFYIPELKIIVEYDERQHFTDQRAKALGLYPAELSMEFNQQEWIAACSSIKATDPSPPHRDEQRAFYDSMRDILATKNGYRLIRFRQGSTDWTHMGAVQMLLAAIETPVLYAAATKQSARQSITDIKKVALISHDYTVPDSRGFYDYSEHFTRINKLCDDHGCDTILYALYTWDSGSFALKTYKSIFDELSHVQRIILEVGRPPDSYDHVEIWARDQREPIMAHQRFATSTSSRSDKQRFLDDLPSRKVGTALLAICGETNMVSLIRGSDDIYDPFGFAVRLRELKIGLILNPIHDYMRRYEMKEKRRIYSQEGRTVVSVWNQGKGRESWLPWTVFHNGEEQTDRVQDLVKPFEERPDIRVGILDLATL